MADDISKKITIGIEAQTDKFTQGVSDLTKQIDALVAKQEQLTAAGQQNSAMFEGISTKLDALQKKLQDAATKITSNAAALNQLGTAAKTVDSAVSSLTDKHNKHAKAAGDSSAKIKGLNSDLNNLAQSANKQKTGIDQGKSSLDAYVGSLASGSKTAKNLQGNVSDTNRALNEQGSAVAENKTAFDAHAITMEHLKTSFNEIKDVSGIFGPSLKEAAEGFSAMKSGLSLVKDGLNGVGAALKTDGFDFLLQILQQIFDYFIKTTKGSKMLKGAISAVGVIVNKVDNFFHSLMDTMINAFSHPVDTLKSLGKMIEENILNRFRAFSVILHGIMHLDFKEMANGAIQAFTGVTNATDKLGSAIKAVKNGVVETAGEMGKAFTEGCKQAGNAMKDHEQNVENSNKRQKASYKNVAEAIPKECGCDDNANSSTLTNGAGAVQPPSSGATNNNNGQPAAAPVNNKSDQSKGNDSVKLTQDTEDKKLKIKQAAIAKAKEYAKNAEEKIASDALSTLSGFIKQQSAAKIAALEKDKAADLSNSSLTSAQKLAIEQKYKQQEGKEKVKAFKEEQDVSIAQAVINGALAITKVTSQSGLAAPIAIGLVIAETAVQVAKIASQKPPAYAQGGLHYVSDGRGTVLGGYSKNDNTNAYLRSGEGVVVSEAMRVPWARNLVSAINVGFGGRDFSIANPGRGYAVGGIFTDGGDANRYYNQPAHDQKNLSNSIAYQMINNFPPVYVDVKDINNQQNILAQTINRVNL